MSALNGHWVLGAWQSGVVSQAAVNNTIRILDQHAQPQGLTYVQNPGVPRYYQQAFDATIRAAAAGGDELCRVALEFNHQVQQQLQSVLEQFHVNVYPAQEVCGLYAD